jgi:glycosyltransferase involved in cell wall biosynthesis
MCVSIIVPNFNHKKFLPQRLETIFNQTFQDFEVILLDDHSTDGSWETLEQFKNHPKVSHCIRNESNTGSPFMQWKKGLDLAKYDWIWIAESDDYSDLHFLEKLVSKISPEVSILFSFSNEVDEFGNPYFNSFKNFPYDWYHILNSSFVMDGDEFIFRFLSFKNIILNSSAAIFKLPKYFPKEILKMKYSGDWFFWIFLCSQNIKVLYLNEKLNYFRNHSQTTRFDSGLINEAKKRNEIFFCFKYAFRFIKFSKMPTIDFKKYEEDVYFYFRVIHKLGRFRLSAFFPTIPIIFYPYYYKFFFLSFGFNKKSFKY